MAVFDLLIIVLTGIVIVLLLVTARRVGSGVRRRPGHGHARRVFAPLSRADQPWAPWPRD